jgi:hypothetical protein
MHCQTVMCRQNREHSNAVVILVLMYEHSKKFIITLTCQAKHRWKLQGQSMFQMKHAHLWLQIWTDD